MSNLTNIDKLKIEKLLGMKSGYVLDFNNRTFGEFVSDSVGIDIWDDRYDYDSGSKANRLRALWMNEPDAKIGKLLKDLLECWKTEARFNDVDISDNERLLYEECLNISKRLLGEKESDVISTEDEFLKKEFKDISINSLRLDSLITGVLEQRFEEIKRCLNSKAALATIFLCGSTLEGILLGVASNNPQEFNKAKTSPKDKNGKVLKFHEWTLSSFIEVAREIGFLNEDVKKFSHALRDFRNYIHPYQQASQQFNPDEHTAKLCWQVLRVAIFQIGKNKP